MVVFKRRKPAQSEITDEFDSLEDLLDQIRMLDADGYPNAFVDVGKFRITFTNANRYSEHLLANAKIKIRDENK